MESIDKVINEIIEEFEMFDDWEEKYSYIIDLGKKLPPLDNKYKTEKNKVLGCVSETWFVKIHGDKVNFLAYSESQIVNGLIKILKRIYLNRTKEEIKHINIKDFFKGISLDKYLSPNRTNSIFFLLKKITS